MTQTFEEWWTERHPYGADPYDSNEREARAAREAGRNAGLEEAAKLADACGHTSPPGAIGAAIRGYVQGRALKRGEKA